MQPGIIWLGESCYLLCATVPTYIADTATVQPGYSQTTAIRTHIVNREYSKSLNSIAQSPSLRMKVAGGLSNEGLQGIARDSRGLQGIARRERWVPYSTKGTGTGTGTGVILLYIVVSSTVYYCLLL